MNINPDRYGPSIDDEPSTISSSGLLPRLVTSIEDGTTKISAGRISPRSDIYSPSTLEAECLNLKRIKETAGTLDAYVANLLKECEDDESHAISKIRILIKSLIFFLHPIEQERLAVYAFTLSLECGALCRECVL